MVTLYTTLALNETQELWCVNSHVPASSNSSLHVETV